MLFFTSMFRNQCKKYTSLSEQEIDSISNMLLHGFQYTFMKSHSLSCAIQGYWCAYYKKHFRKEFGSAFSK